MRRERSSSPAGSFRMALVAYGSQMPPAANWSISRRRTLSSVNHNFEEWNNTRSELGCLALLNSQITHTVIKPIIVPGREGECDWVYYAQLSPPRRTLDCTLHNGPGIPDTDILHGGWDLVLLHAARQLTKLEPHRFCIRIILFVVGCTAEAPHTIIWVLPLAPYPMGEGGEAGGAKRS